MIDASLFVAGGPEPRGFTKDVRVAAPRAEVFRVLTTREGWAALLGVRCRVELRIGGPLEIDFMEDAPEGARGSEGCQFLAYVPGRMVAFSWNAPPHLPGARARRTWVAITLTNRCRGTTRVRLAHLGFGTGDEWDATLAYFDRAWDQVLEQLVGHFAGT